MGGATEIWAASRLNPGICIIVCTEGNNPQGTFTPYGIFAATTGATQGKYLLYTPSMKGTTAHYDVTEPIKPGATRKRSGKREQWRPGLGPR